MANRYWVGGSGNWDATTTTHWSDTYGGAGGFSVPTISDDVYLYDAGSTVTLTTTGICNNLEIDLLCTFTTNSNFSANQINIAEATVNIGSSIWTILGIYFSANNPLGIINCGTSTIKFTNNSATSKGFDSGGHTFYNVWVATQGEGTMTFYNGGTYNQIKIDAGRYCIFQNDVFYVNDFIAIGTLGNLITLNSDSGDGTKILSKSSGIVNCDYLSIIDFPVGGGAEWYAGINTIYSGDVRGWIFPLFRNTKKNNTIFSNINKNLSEFTNQSKNISSFINNNKNSVIFTNQDKNSAIFTNEIKS